MLQFPSSIGRYISWNGVFYNRSSINIADIGEQSTDCTQTGSTLVCAITNVNAQCCRGSDNPNGGGIGGWLDPNNTPIPSAGALGGASKVFTHYLYSVGLNLKEKEENTKRIKDQKITLINIIIIINVINNEYNKKYKQ